MYNNNIVNFKESTTILNTHTKKSLETYRMLLVSVILKSDAYVIINKSNY